MLICEHQLLALAWSRLQLKKARHEVLPHHEVIRQSLEKRKARKNAKSHRLSPSSLALLLPIIP
ncbi:hypothetical protein [Xenorhabdus japonica]|uniref:hypothetical protein n=1 Tax=Xenorhabdus japonica TaxID=53341 RepID=UPI001FE0ED22|nr:hypothetical protein [Xenorhabdus japonica]